MSVKVIQIDPVMRDGVRMKFRYRTVEWSSRFVVTRSNSFGKSKEDDAVFDEVTEWCRERFREPMHYDRDYPRNWAVYNFLSSACSIYFSTSEQALEFKMRWV